MECRKIEVIVSEMTNLQNLGERKAIEHLTKNLDKRGLLLGFEDDCAALEFGNKLILITTDMITEHTHIPPGSTPYQIGWYIVAVNLSDLAAKGAVPLGMLVALGMPNQYTTKFLRELARGLNACTKKYGTKILGGDTKSNSTLTLSGTAIGIVSKKEFMPRKGCRPGDIVAVTGELGRAAAGFYAIKNARNIKDAYNWLLKPNPRIKEGKLLAQSKIVTSCMDLSDSLGASLSQLSNLNKVGFRIDFDKLPISRDAFRISKNTGTNLEEMVLYFGGDYELLVTLPAAEYMRLSKIFKNSTRIPSNMEIIRKTGLTPIGVVTKARKNIVRINSTDIKLYDRSFEHFK